MARVSRDAFATLITLLTVFLGTMVTPSTGTSFASATPPSVTRSGSISHHAAITARTASSTDDTPATALSPTTATSSTTTTTTTPFTYPIGGAFVLGDQTVSAALSATAPQTVTWWGARWSTANSLSGGAAPSSFKGFAADLAATPQPCGETWTTRPGNSAPPPSSVPAYMAVIVAGHITKSGSTISGDTSQVVIVKTAPGYQPDPGHPGTGTVVGVLCPATLALRLTAPSTVSPAASVPYTVQVRNTGPAPATAGSLALAYPDGSTAHLSLPTIAPGDTITRTLPYTVSALAPKGASESDSVYQARLAAVDGMTLPATATVSWHDGQGLPAGTATAQAQSIERVPVLSVTAPVLPPTLTPGQTVPLSVTVSNTGSGAARDVVVRFTAPNGSVTAPTTTTLASGQAVTLLSSWLVPRLPATSTESESAYESRLAAINNANQTVTAAATWRDAAANSYGPVSGEGLSSEPVPIVDLGITGPWACSHDR